jgi:hypothetical protein
MNDFLGKLGIGNQSGEHIKWLAKTWVGRQQLENVGREYVSDVEKLMFGGTEYGYSKQCI